MSKSNGVPQSVMTTARRLYDHYEYYDAIGGEVTVETELGEEIEFTIDIANPINGNIAIYSPVVERSIDDRDLDPGRYRVMINNVDSGLADMASTSVSFTREDASNIRLGRIEWLEVEAGTDD